MTRSKISNHIKKKWEIKYTLISSDERNNVVKVKEDDDDGIEGGERKEREKKTEATSVYAVLMFNIISHI